MNRAALEAALDTRWLGRALHVHDSLGSTSDEAARLARDGAPHGTVVVAERQLAGRGRLGRTWYSPPGENLYFSAVLRMDLPPQAAPPVTLAAGVAVCDAARSAGVQVGLKWPNDLVVQGRKMGGILTETSVQAGIVQAIILGVGVDVNTEQFPDELAPIATSMRRELGQPVAREPFLAAILLSLETWLDRFRVQGAAAVVAAWRTRAVTLGRRVQLDSGEGLLTGVARDVDDDGALLLELDDGARHRVLAGEIRHD